MNKILKSLFIAIGSLALAIVLTFFIYVSNYEKATEPALEAMQSQNNVVVEETRSYITYLPETGSDIGIIFYPGGKVEPSVYSRVFSQLAQKGIGTVVVKMPFNLAMFNISGAESVLEDFSGIEKWYLGGHSLGGVFATSYLKDNMDKFEGMFFLASYPAADLSRSSIKVLSINGTLDTVINREGFEEGKKKLPPQSIFLDIEGGNHTQFGDYNLQKGDTEATISAEEQQRQIVEAIFDFITFL